LQPRTHHHHVNAATLADRGIDAGQSIPYCNEFDWFVRL
jgi:hypothetical protein